MQEKVLFQAFFLHNLLFIVLIIAIRAYAYRGKVCF